MIYNSSYSDRYLNDIFVCSYFIYINWFALHYLLLAIPFLVKANQFSRLAPKYYTNRQSCIRTDVNRTLSNDFILKMLISSSKSNKWRHDSFRKVVKNICSVVLIKQGYHYYYTMLTKFVPRGYCWKYE